MLDYKVSKEDLEYLSERVKKMQDLTELACKEKEYLMFIPGKFA